MVFYRTFDEVLSVLKILQDETLVNVLSYLITKLDSKPIYYSVNSLAGVSTLTPQQVYHRLHIIDKSPITMNSIKLSTNEIIQEDIAYLDELGDLLQLDEKTSQMSETTRTLFSAESDGDMRLVFCHDQDNEPINTKLPLMNVREQPQLDHQMTRFLSNPQNLRFLGILRKITEEGIDLGLRTIQQETFTTKNIEEIFVRYGQKSWKNEPSVKSLSNLGLIEADYRPPLSFSLNYGGIIEKIPTKDTKELNLIDHGEFYQYVHDV